MLAKVWALAQARPVGDYTNGAFLEALHLQQRAPYPIQLDLG